MSEKEDSKIEELLQKARATGHRGVRRMGAPDWDDNVSALVGAIEMLAKRVRDLEARKGPGKH